MPWVMGIGHTPYGHNTIQKERNRLQHVCPHASLAAFHPLRTSMMTTCAK